MDTKNLEERVRYLEAQFNDSTVRIARPGGGGRPGERKFVVVREALTDAVLIRVTPITFNPALPYNDVFAFADAQTQLMACWPRLRGRHYKEFVHVGASLTYPNPHVLLADKIEGVWFVHQTMRWAMLSAPSGFAISDCSVA